MCVTTYSKANVILISREVSNAVILVKDAKLNTAARADTSHLVEELQRAAHDVTSGLAHVISEQCL